MTKRKDPKDKLPAGRPTTFKPEYVKQAFQLALLGLTDVEIAQYFEVDVSTLGNWKVNYPEILEALRDGKQKADGKVARALYKRACGYKYIETSNEEYIDANGVPRVSEKKTNKIMPPDPAAARYWLNNRQPKKWRDKIDVNAHVEGEVIVGFKIVKQ